MVYSALVSIGSGNLQFDSQRVREATKGFVPERRGPVGPLGVRRTGEMPWIRLPSGRCKGLECPGASARHVPWFGPAVASLSLTGGPFQIAATFDVADAHKEAMATNPGSFRLLCSWIQLGVKIDPGPT